MERMLGGELSRTFEPVLVPKHAEIYGIDVSPTLISAVTDAVVEEVTAWQSRSLEPMYPVVFFDALRVKIRDESVVRSKAARNPSLRIRTNPGRILRASVSPPCLRVN
jgi:hypothetical protein